MITALNAVHKSTKVHQSYQKLGFPPPLSASVETARSQVNNWLLKSVPQILRPYLAQIVWANIVVPTDYWISIMSEVEEFWWCFSFLANQESSRFLQKSWESEGPRPFLDLRKSLNSRQFLDEFGHICLSVSLRWTENGVPRKWEVERDH